MGGRILGVCGSTRAGSRTRQLLDVAIAAARAAGAETEILDLAETRLPVFDDSDEGIDALPEVRRVRETAARADGFLLATPEYHGGPSGAIKNWIDYLWKELSGKTAGCIAMTSTGNADLAVMGMATHFMWCHGFVLPLRVAARDDDFDAEGLSSDRVRDRLDRIGRDIVRYAAVLRGAFEEARALGKGSEAGIAGFHVKG